jgi:hypothetical protein
MQFVGNSAGAGNANPDALGTQVVSRCAGDTYSLPYGYISAAGDAHRPLHPDVCPAGFGPPLQSYANSTANANQYRGPIKNPWTNDLLFTPAFGLSDKNNEGRWGLYWPLTEEDGSTVYGVAPRDIGSAQYWSFRPLRAGVTTAVKLRVYVPSGPCSIIVNGGQNWVTFSSLATGWHTLSTTIAAGDMIADATAGSESGFVNINSTSNVRFYFTWATINQTPVTETQP